MVWHAVTCAICACLQEAILCILVACGVLVVLRMVLVDGVGKTSQVVDLQVGRSCCSTSWLQCCAAASAAVTPATRKVARRLPGGAFYCEELHAFHTYRRSGGGQRRPVSFLAHAHHDPPLSQPRAIQLVVVFLSFHRRWPTCCGAAVVLVAGQTRGGPEQLLKSLGTRP